ncbi:transporter substrate-binding domain-containing protein [Labrys wisconsinensis]|uniref:Polar amino acid transport system substrate-binding protein n=1 Tax=Labrys wisconsinensis TaxID=425677 RepID=A0ABU0JLH5_9HYPH|nr:transporter substrate-binding domain-containing protein [Labrys wisconsinensis]MDQ0474089.1 polar amino acid transport system substrate-binding protein [Labrys wisconsinensis]
MPSILLSCAATARRLLACAVLAPLVLGGIAAAARAADLQTIEPGTILVGSDQVYPPYDYVENGVTKGLDADVMALIAPKLGRDVRFVDTRFANLIAGLQANRYDLIASALYVTPARAEVVDYIPYAKTGGSLMVRSDDSFAPKQPEDLCGKRVGNLKGAAWVPELRKTSDAGCAANPIGVQEYATSAEAAQALLSRGVDAVFDDAGVSQAAVAASGNRLKITSDQILFPVVMGLAVKKGNAQLLAAMQEQMDALIASGAYGALLRKYNLAMPTADEIKAALSQTN